MTHCKEVAMYNALLCSAYKVCCKYFLLIRKKLSR